MTKFNPKNKEVMTYGDCLKPAMEITEQDDADQYLKDYITYQRTYSKSHEEALKNVKINLGYFAGYYDNETRERVERLFNCNHPVFGSIKINGSPTTKEALNAGLNYSK